jgi:hypothetical protein
MTPAQACVVAFLGLTATSAFAQSPFRLTDTTTGAEVYRLCETDISECELFAAQALVGVSMADLFRSEGPRTYCLPATVSPTQGRLIIVRYMRDRPELLHQPAAELIRAALKQAFPCP